MRDADEPSMPVQGEPVERGAVRLRVPEARPDEVTFYLVALLVGALCGCLAVLA